ncbi:MAG TPA: alpha/beta hydrolase, partial [Streptomyces sp.]|nr:alpha/beta hydrolase [Streptomyces sp.]
MSRLTHLANTPPVPVRELAVVSADGSRIHVELH